MLVVIAIMIKHFILIVKSGFFCLFLNLVWAYTTLTDVLHRCTIPSPNLFRGVMVKVIAVDLGSSHGRFKPKIIKWVFGTSPRFKDISYFVLESE